MASPTVQSTSGKIRTISDNTPTTGEGTLSATWAINKWHTGQLQNSTSGNGYSARFNIKTDGSGNPTFYFSETHRGYGYVVGDTLTFIDPEDDY